DNPRPPRSHTAAEVVILLGGGIFSVRCPSWLVQADEPNERPWRGGGPVAGRDRPGPPARSAPPGPPGGPLPVRCGVRGWAPLCPPPLTPATTAPRDSAGADFFILLCPSALLVLLPRECCWRPRSRTRWATGVSRSCPATGKTPAVTSGTPGRSS